MVETVALAGLITLVVLLSLGLIPAFGLANRRAGAELEAGRLAQSALELQRSKPFEEMVSNASEETIEKDQVVFRRTVVVEPGPEPNLKRIRARVSWRWKERDYETFRETLVVRVPR